MKFIEVQQTQFLTKYKSNTQMGKNFYLQNLGTMIQSERGHGKKEKDSPCENKKKNN